MRRRSVLLGLSALALGSTVVPRPAGALSQDPIAVSQDSPKTTREYAVIAGNNTAGADAPEFGPAGCSTGGALSAACDAIPVEIVRPAEYDDYSPWGVMVTLEWEAEQLTDDEVQETQSNDMDMYFYYKTGEQLSTDGATGTRPETAMFVSPASDTYYVIVNNYLGANTGYSVTVELVPEERVEQVTEADFARPRTPRPPPPGARPSSTTTMVTTTTTAPDDDDSGLTPVEVGDDNDFTAIGSGAGARDAENIFQAGDPLAVQNAEEPAPPASSLALVLWLVALPVVLVAIGWWVLRRRAPTSIVTG